MAERTFPNLVIPTFLDLVIPMPEAEESRSHCIAVKIRPMTTNQSIPVYHGAGN
jgi:hypothetical protein